MCGRWMLYGSWCFCLSDFQAIQGMVDLPICSANYSINGGQQQQALRLASKVRFLSAGQLPAV